ncbi:MAG: SET domain-containing protein-lysine N-methyltransferase [Candidatus Methylacidiphilales bacterium]
MERPPESLFVHPALYVMPCEFGFGVFSDDFIASGTLLEECHWIKYRRADCQSPKINDYVYEVADTPQTPDEEKGYNALVLGFGSIYNHSFDNNAHYLYDEARNVFVYQAIKDIQPGDQIFISYGEQWWNTRQE